jgi:ankyrin repeat protein
VALALAALAPSTQAATNSEIAAAAMEDNAELVAALTKARVDINKPDEDGATALAWAARNRNLPLAQSLIRAGADANIANEYGVGPLILAAQAGDAKMVLDLLLAGANPNQAMWNGETALMHAARDGSVESLQYLISANADVNAREARDGQTALMWAAAAGQTDSIRTLLDGGADAKIKTPTIELTAASRGATTPRKLYRGGFNALLFAAQSFNKDAVAALLNAGQDVNVTAADGSTPLLLAMYHHINPQSDFPLNTEVVADLDTAELLLSKGANPNLASADGVAPLTAAVFTAHGHDHLGSLTDVPAVIKPHDAAGERGAQMLLARGADPNIAITDYTVTSPAGQDPRSSGRYANVSAFMLAAALNKPKIVKMMIDSGRVETKKADARGVTPLMQAVKMNSLAGVEALVAAGVDVNAADAQGNTALHLVAANRPGSGAIADLLVKAGGNVKTKNAEGKTPVDIASVEPPAGGPGGPPRRPGGAVGPTDPVVQALGVPVLSGTTAKVVILAAANGTKLPADAIKVAMGIRDSAADLAPDLARRDQPVS